MSGKLKWQKVKVAEDELSTLWKDQAEINTEEQLREGLALMSQGSLWDDIEALAEKCDGILAEHGFPRASERVRHDGASKWWRHPDDAPKRPPSGERWEFTPGHKFTKANTLGFSDPWYAAQLGCRCRQALWLSRNGHSGKLILHELV